MSGGHEHVKAVLVDHLADNLPAWLTVIRDGDTWPLDPKLVAASDILPDKDEQWPCVLVTSTSMNRRMAADTVATGEFIGRYDVTVTVGARGVKERDADEAAAGRDRLLLAVRNLFLASPGLDEDTTCLLSGLTEETGAVAVDVKGRPVAIGSVSLQVQYVETIPDLASVTADSADVHLAVTDADGSLYTNAEYVGDVTYDDAGTVYDGGTEWPPKS